MYSFWRQLRLWLGFCQSVQVIDPSSAAVALQRRRDGGWSGDVYQPACGGEHTLFINYDNI